MKVHIKAAAQCLLAAKRIFSRKYMFLGLFVITFSGSYAALSGLDLLPETKPFLVTYATQGMSQMDSTERIPAVPAAPENPILISIAKISLQVPIANPTTNDIQALDAALLKGAVRYPTSARLGENGNVVLFGHSSYLPVVHNQAYKAFDDIQKLKEGDIIMVHSSGRIYTYAVEHVTKVSANDGVIPLAISGKKLTLSTCDSFGAKTDRFVVTAGFIESKPLLSAQISIHK